MADWPDLKEVRTLLRLQPDATEDAVIATALAAAIDYGNRRTNYKYPPPQNLTLALPDAAHEACLLHAAKLYRRRDTLDGAIGWPEAGIMRVGSRDPDVDALYSSIGPVVFG